MDFFTILTIAIGLAMDAFAVSIAGGATLKYLHFRRALTMAVFFGAFQALMPILGWFTGLNLKEFIAGIDHWIAFGILSAIGLKMIYESAQLSKSQKIVSVFSITTLFILSIATSIDALAVGFSFAFLNVSIALPVVVIGIVAFVFTFLGVCIGCKLGHFFESKIEIVGGIILIGIGTKILLEHLGYL